MFTLRSGHKMDNEEKRRRAEKMKTCTRAQRVQSRRYHFILSAGVILTAGVAAPTLEAANSSAGETGLSAGIHSVKSVRPFLEDRYVQLKPVEQKPTSSTPDADPSQHRTALSGGPR
jgi:pyruvate/2-oxoacid:ferredoxin oxidoreductase alpha subunit